MDYTEAQALGYVRAHRRLQARQLVDRMDAQRAAAHAELDDYRDIRAELLDVDGTQRLRDSTQHRQASLDAFGISPEAAAAWWAQAEPGRTP